MDELTKKRVIKDPVARIITTKYKHDIWKKFLAAIYDYQLIDENDKICVCISGGKDSMLLAKCFMLYQAHVNPKVAIKYLVMDPGYNKENIDLIKHNVAILGIPAEIISTNIFEIAYMQDHSPCYLCAKMRRGALYRLAQDMGCNKIALGHHYDDVIETTLMNMINAGSFQTMLPKVHSDNYDNMELIRPLYYIRERDVISWAKYSNLHFLQCACKFTETAYKEKESERYKTKMLIAKLEQENPNYAKNIFKANSNVVLDKVVGYKDSNGLHSFLDNYSNFKRPVKKNK